MKCKCGHRFCWKCLKSWRPYHTDFYNCTGKVSLADTVYNKTRVDKATCGMLLLTAGAYVSRKCGCVNAGDEYHYKALFSNVNAKIVQLRDVIRPLEAMKAHLFDTLQALKLHTGKSQDNDMPVYCYIGLEDYIIQK